MKPATIIAGVLALLGTFHCVSTRSEPCPEPDDRGLMRFDRKGPDGLLSNDENTRAVRCGRYCWVEGPVVDGPDRRFILCVK